MRIVYHVMVHNEVLQDQEEIYQGLSLLKALYRFLITGRKYCFARLYKTVEIYTRGLAMGYVFESTYGSSKRGKK